MEWVLATHSCSLATSFEKLEISNAGSKVAMRACIMHVCGRGGTGEPTQVSYRFEFTQVSYMFDLREGSLA